MGKKKKNKSVITFENSFARQLYLEISGVQDMRSIKKSYITQEYIWGVWQQVYKSNFGCTKYMIKI